MQIVYECGGGVTGMAGRRRCTVDSSELPSHLGMVAEGIYQSELNKPSHTVLRPDELYCELTFRNGNSQVVVLLSRHKLAAAIRPLVEWLDQQCISSGK